MRTVTDPFLIRLAWGPRRVTSSKRYGTLKPEDAYPTSISASDTLWMEWIINGIERWRNDEWAVVIPETKAEARIREQIVDLLPEPEPEPDTISDEEFDRLMEERASLRKERKFEEADRIRDHLEAHGRKVLDAKIEST